MAWAKRPQATYLSAGSLPWITQDPLAPLLPRWRWPEAAEAMKFNQFCEDVFGEF